MVNLGEVIFPQHKLFAQRPLVFSPLTLEPYLKKLTLTVSFLFFSQKKKVNCILGFLTFLTGGQKTNT